MCREESVREGGGEEGGSERVLIEQCLFGALANLRQDHCSATENRTT